MNDSFRWQWIWEASDLPHAPGVYALVGISNHEGRFVSYVGQAVDLFRRIRTHQKRWSVDAYGMRFRLERWPGERLRAERRLIRRLQPPGNKCPYKQHRRDEKLPNHPDRPPFGMEATSETQHA